MRVSIFVGTDIDNIAEAAKTGADRVELYTEPYAAGFKANAAAAVAPFAAAAEAAYQCGLGLNAGHDLSLENLAYFKAHVPHLKEVSIGHNLVCEALSIGLEQTVKAYQECLKEQE